MKRDSRNVVRRQAWLSLLWASLGCFSMEPISSYSDGQREVSPAPSALEPESPTSPPAAPPPDESDSLEPGSLEEALPSEEAPAAEGLPGDGQVALDPGLAQEPSDPEPVPSCTAAGEFSSPDGASCYLTSRQDAAWPDALASCESWGGSLVSIESREEDVLLAEHMTTTFWIAASDRVQEGRVVWSGGAPLVFANWSAGQPDDFQGREDCVVKTAPAGTWNDRPCGNVIPYVCERLQE